MAEAKVKSAIARSLDGSHYDSDLANVSPASLSTRIPTRVPEPPLPATCSSRTVKQKTRPRKTPKKDEVGVLRQEMSTVKEQLSSATEQISALADLVKQKLFNENGTSGAHRHTSSVHNMENGTLGAHRPSTSQNENNDQQVRRPLLPLENSLDDDYNVGSQRRPLRACDEISLMPGQLERHSLLGSNTSSDSEVREQICDKTDRFSKYVKPNEHLSDETVNLLRDMFGDDATTKACAQTQDGLTLDASQIEILNNSWHIENPDSLTAYREDYRLYFPVHESTAAVLTVPKFDDMIEQLIVERHGKKAATSSVSKHIKLFSQPAKSIEKFAFQGQTAAARMGILANVYIHQTLGSLLTKLQCNDPNIDLVTQMVRDIFAMSTKALDQVARAGAYHHVIRRKAGLIDTGLDSIPDVNKQLSALPLSSAGVFGIGLEEKLKQRHEKRNQLKEVLPELGHLVSKPTSGTYKRKHDAYTDNYPSKQARGDRSYTIPKYNQQQPKWGISTYGQPTYESQRGFSSRKPDFKKSTPSSLRGNGRYRK